MSVSGIINGLRLPPPYQQIADDLVVSINTVRHDVKGIYSKLYADTRTRAIEKARTLKLI